MNNYLWAGLASLAILVLIRHRHRLVYAVTGRKHIGTINVMHIKPSPDGCRYSKYPNGDAPPSEWRSKG